MFWKLVKDIWHGSANLGQEVAKAMPAPVKTLTLEERLGDNAYQADDLRSLYDFVERLKAAKLVAWCPDDGALDGTNFLVDFYGEFIGSDGLQYHVHKWDSYSGGRMTLMTFSIYKVTNTVAQGDLYDDPTILEEGEYRKILSDTIAWNYDTWTNPEGSEFLNKECDKAAMVIKAIVLSTPHGEKEKLTTPFFHKAWDQMPLELDNPN